MRLYNKYKAKGAFGFGTCKELAEAIASKLEADGLISKLELSMSEQK